LSKRNANSTYQKVAAQGLNQAMCFHQSLCLVTVKCSEIATFAKPENVGKKPPTSLPMSRKFLLRSLLLLGFLALAAFVIWKVGEINAPSANTPVSSTSPKQTKAINETNYSSYIWATNYDTLRNDEFLRRGEMLDSTIKSPNTLIEILNLRTPECKLKYIGTSNDTLTVRILNEEILSEQMGSTGSLCFLAETIYTLTEIKGITYINIKMNYGSHAGPGVFSRGDFKQMIRKSDS